MSEDRIEALFLERARLRSLGAPSQMYRATSTGFNPITFEPGPESNPILGGNEMQGFPQPTADDAMQERAPSNEVGGRMSDLAANALQLLGDDFGAAYQQFRISEVENRIEDGSLQPVDYQMAVIENPTVPLGDYYDAASGTFSGVPSDDYILHQGKIYPRKLSIDKLTEHHLNNIANNNSVQNTDGTISTIRTISFESDGKTYLVPTVFDGKILSNEEAIDRAFNEGVFEVFPTLAEAEAFDEKIHSANPVLGGQMSAISQDEAQQILSSLDLSEDNQLINFGRALMGGMLEAVDVPLPTIARGVARFVKGGAPDPTVMNMGMGDATVPVDRAADVSDIGFYSAVNRAVEALPMEKGSASQMRAMIAKSEGVKPEEMAWIGLDDFLKGKKSVTKAEVQEYVQANQVQIEEVTKRGDLPQRTGDEWQELIDNAEAQGDYDAADALTQQWEAAEGLGGTAYPDSPKFASYTLPGGENYREVLLTLPKNRGVDVERYEELKQKDIAGKLNDPDEVAEFNQLMDSGSNIYRGGHFDEPNVLAHMRLNDRIGPNDERILFIEEIQSDWHQKGRKTGYKTPENTAAIAQINGRLNKLLDREMEINGDLFDNYGLGGTASPYGNGVNFYSRDIIENNDYKVIGRVNANGSFYVDEAFGAANPAIADRIKELSEISAERAQLKQQRSEITGPSRDLARVPDAPMKKTWHEMSFRRVARMAAEEGYDAIAWTPGKMQAERYDLSKQVDEIRAIRNEDGSFNVYAVDKRSYGIEDVIFDRDNLDIAGVEELVGKDLAEKIQGQNKVEEAYTGIDLQVGGEGMKGFYDKILKNYAAKWGKKFGAKVGVTDIRSREYTQGEPVETGVPIDEMNDQQLLGELGYSNIKDVETKVWTLPVTKKMRDSIMKKGVPLFTAGGAVAMSQVEGKQNDN
jgi:hypothetical protein|tara:strand:- start:398 stop:3160 length:2763 start_codon:yes stop_codon:yes gene_type:complete